MVMKTLLAAFILAFLPVTFIMANDFSPYSKHWFTQKTDTLPYRLLLPENYDPQKQYPLIVFLHGAGERGKDNEKHLKNGGAYFLNPTLRKNYPAIVVMPQCSFFSFWSNIQFAFDTVSKKPGFNYRPDGEPTLAMKMAVDLVGKLMDDYPVKRDQVYVGGLSMGGMGTFEIVRRLPGTFAAAFPICGGAHPATAPQLTNTAWWVFHGAKDPVVPLESSEKMVSALKQIPESQVKFTVYPQALHNSWDSAFAEPGLMPWLMEQKRRE